MGGVIFMDEDLIWWFCYLPKIFNASVRLKWTIEAGLERNLQKMLEFEPGLSREEALVIFIEQFGNGNDKCAAKHLQAYLYKIAGKTARDFYYNQFNYSGSLGLEDIYQEGFKIASEPGKFFATYNSSRGTYGYIYNDIKHKIRDQVFQKLLRLKDAEIQLKKSRKYRILYTFSGKKLKQALKFSGYPNIKLESYFLAWECFKEVYAPVKGEKHNPPTPEQLEVMAERYPILRRKGSPELKQDNSQVNAEFIRQCLENAIEALYQYNSHLKEISYDAPAKNGEGTTFIDLRPEERYNSEADATMLNYYRAYSLNFQESDDLLHNLDSKEYGSLILYYVFELSMDAIAELYQENKSQVSRRINKSNKKWLEEFCQRYGMSKKAEEFRAQKKLDANISKLVNDVRKKNKKYSHSQAYQMFLKIRQQLQPSSQEILESKHNLGQQLYSKLCGDHHNAQINSYRERLEKLLDVNWLYPEKILVSSGRGGKANANQVSKKEQSIQLKRGKIIELDNQRFVLMIEIKQGKENQDIKLSFKLIPRGEDTTSLPSGLELALLNSSGKVLTSNTARTGDNQLFIPPNPRKPATIDLEKLENNIKKGKVFQIKITLNGKSKTEPFPVL